MDVPEKLKYSAEHEWLAVDGKTGTVGITAFAVEQIGDIVFVELPAIGSTVEATKPFGVIESVKAVSELFAPASGKVVAINDRARRRSGDRGEGLLRCRLADQDRTEQSQRRQRAQ